MAGIRPLSPELQEMAIQNLQEDPSRLEADIAHIREWLTKQPHIRANPDNQTLVAFLRGCKFSLEQTKEKLDMYYTLHTAVPEFFKDRNVNDKTFRELMQLQTFFPLPQPDDLGRRIFIVRPGLHDSSKISLQDFIRMNFMCIDVLLRDDDNIVVGGIVTIVDLTGVSISIGGQFTPSLAKKIFVCSQEALPMRPKSINYINTPSIIDPLLALVKSLTKEKIRKRLNFHGYDMKSLHKKIPQHLLPTEYGGNAGTMKEINDAWIKKLDKYHDFFLQDSTFGVDESKRPGKPKTHKDLFGLEGSFRQLNVD